MYAQQFVISVRLNAICLKTSTVKLAQIPAGSVPMNAEKWPICKKLCWVPRWTKKNYFYKLLKTFINDAIITTTK
jgi:hypothetical protein